MKPAFLAIVVCLLSLPAQAFTGHVLRCHDGDTCTVSTGQGTLKIRLAEIDAPEIGQPYGDQAQAILCGMICGRTVDVEDTGQRSYDRVVGIIRVGGLDTSEEMVREGAAWLYPQYNFDSEMPGLEVAARAGHLGLWAAPAPTAPWDWRHNRNAYFSR